MGAEPERPNELSPITRIDTARVRPVQSAAGRSSRFWAGRVDFTGAIRWSRPPMFTWNGKPPAGVVLPVQPPKETRSSSSEADERQAEMHGSDAEI
jgi:hypothetical protein